MIDTEFQQFNHNVIAGGLANSSRQYNAQNEIEAQQGTFSSSLAGATPVVQSNAPSLASSSYAMMHTYSGKFTMPFPPNPMIPANFSNDLGMFAPYFRAPLLPPMTPELLYVCKHCKKTFARKAHLTRHLNIHAPNDNWDFVCPEEDCGKRFYRSDKLKQHIKRCHPREDED